MTKQIWTLGAGAFAIVGTTAMTVDTNYSQIVGLFALTVGALALIILLRKGKREKA